MRISRNCAALCRNVNSVIARINMNRAALHSPRYCPERVPDLVGGLVCDPTYPAARGTEWEIRTYLTVAW